MVVIQDATEPFSAVDGTLDASPWWLRSEMVVLRVFLHGLAKVALAQRNDLSPDTRI